MMLEEGRSVCFHIILHCGPGSPDLCLFDDTQLVDGAAVKLSGTPTVCTDQNGNIQPLPVHSGSCCIDGSLFLIGGLQATNGVTGQIRSKWVLSVKAADSPPPPPGDIDILNDGWTWTFKKSMKNDRVFPKLVPHDGKIYIFGGSLKRRSWVEVYDPKENKFLKRAEAPEEVVYTAGEPDSCFLLDSESNVERAGGSECSKKPVFMVCLCGYDEPSRLLSYDAQNNHWETFDPNFPLGSPYPKPMGRNLIPYRDILFIIDYVDAWTVYDLSSRGVDQSSRVVDRMQVKGLEKYKDRQVLKAFCQPQSQRILIFTIFMEGDEEYESGGFHGIPYAKVRVKRKGETFRARVAAEGILDVGTCFGYLIFAHQPNQTSKRSAVEFPPGVKNDEKKMKL